MQFNYQAYEYLLWNVGPDHALLCRTPDPVLKWGWTLDPYGLRVLAYPQEDEWARICLCDELYSCQGCSCQHLWYSEVFYWLSPSPVSHVLLIHSKRMIKIYCYLCTCMYITRTQGGLATASSGLYMNELKPYRSTGFSVLYIPSLLIITLIEVQSLESDLLFLFALFLSFFPVIPLLLSFLSQAFLLLFFSFLFPSLFFPYLLSSPVWMIFIKPDL